MTDWPSTQAKTVLSALLRIGFHDREEIGPRMLARIAKHSGLRPEDL
jgi:hypothetical protein